MASSCIPDSLLFEIAPPLSVGGRPALCAQLHRMIAEGSPKRWSEAAGHALLLAALQYRFADCLVRDLRLEPRPPFLRRWRRDLSRGATQVPCLALTWVGVASVDARPLPLTRMFLRSMPDRFVRLLPNWAPPVVTPVDSHGRNWVVANHLSALVARQLLSGEAVRVRQLAHTPSAMRPLSVLAQAMSCVLQPLYEQNRGRIAALAGNDQEAQFLTGYSRAQCFRLRGGRDERVA